MTPGLPRRSVARLRCPRPGRAFGAAMLTRLALAWLRALAIGVGALGSILSAAPAIASPGVPQTPLPGAPPALVIHCPASPSTAPGKDFHGQTLAFANFSRMDLTNANFQGATLKGAVFIGANLTGANFSNATFVDSGSPIRTTDFSFATLDSACFMGARFNAPTYFTYATLTCTDFSLTDNSHDQAIFGDEPVRYTPSLFKTGCRTAFRRATMNCELVDEWHNFDLSDAIVGRCKEQLRGADLAGTVMPGVDFSSMVLDGSDFARADLSRAVFTGASLQCLSAGGTTRCVDMDAAQLQGADFSKANLTGASLRGAFLSNDLNSDENHPATLTHAHLKNVDLAFSQLTGVDFSYANFYGDQHANPGGCGASGPGVVRTCASAQGAQMVGTNFTGAYLYGVDFRGSKLQGVSFIGAVLVGASFAGATIGTNVNGSDTSFLQAYLQGTDLDLATSLEANLTDAFLDFRPDGNFISILLNGQQHNRFACPGGGCAPSPGADVCVAVSYVRTTVPATITTITCPDNALAGAAGCGAGQPDGSNARWKSSLDIGAPPDLPPAWYRNDASYTPRQTSDGVVCGGMAKNPPVFYW